MPTSYYHTVAGQITSQTVSGTRTHILTDAIASATVTVSDSGSVDNSYRYKPYGAILARAGAAPDPKFLWAAGWGYRRQGTAAPTHYIRERHFASLWAAWAALDPYWPRQHPYSYAFCNPVQFVDPLGTDPTCQYCCCCPDSMKVLSDSKSFDNFYNKQPTRLTTDAKRTGHYFRVEYTTSTRSWSKPQNAPCVMEWWECNNYEKHKNKWGEERDFDTWYDETNHYLAGSKTPFNGASGCGSPPVTDYLEDEPSVLHTQYVKYVNLKGYRALWINVRIKSDPDCPCPNTKLDARAVQVLGYYDGAAHVAFWPIDHSVDSILTNPKYPGCNKWP